MLRVIFLKIGAKQNASDPFNLIYTHKTHKGEPHTEEQPPPTAPSQHQIAVILVFLIS